MLRVKNDMWSYTTGAPSIWCRILFWSQNWKNFQNLSPYNLQPIHIRPGSTNRMNFKWKIGFFEYFLTFDVFVGIVSGVFWANTIWNAIQTIKSTPYDIFYEKMFIFSVPRAVYHLQLDIPLTILKVISLLLPVVRPWKLDVLVGMCTNILWV